MSRVLISIVLLLGAIAPVTLAQPLGAPAPLPPIAAKAWLLYDYQAGREIVASARDERVEPASLTKLMVAYLTFSAIRHGQVAISQAVLVSPKAKATPTHEAARRCAEIAAHMKAKIKAPTASAMSTRAE